VGRTHEMYLRLSDVLDTAQAEKGKAVSPVGEKGGKGLTNSF